MEKPEIIINKSYNYQLLKDQTGYILSVLCGTVGMFDVDIRLSDEEAQAVISSADSPDLVHAIRENPTSYTSRQINLNSLLSLAEKE